MAENEAQGSGPSAMIIAILVALLTLGGGFFLAYSVLPARLAQELVKAQGGGGGAHAGADHSGSGKAAGSKDGGRSVDKFEIQDLLVNVKDTRGTRFVKASVFFQAEKNVLTELETRRAQMQDIVMSAIGSKTMEELTAFDSKAKLKTEIISTINPLLNTKGEVRDVFFPEFIIQ